MRNKKSNTPKRKALNRPGRLQSAKEWIWVYRGKNLVSKYAKHYGTDLLCAIAELRMLGVAVPAAYEEDIKRSVAARARHKQRMKEAAENQYSLNDYQGGDCPFIECYTDSGSPLSLGWDEFGI